MAQPTSRQGYYSESYSVEQRRRWYDPVAAAYDQARPRYPAALLDRAMAVTGWQAGDTLLEIGSGPGIATLSLAERGFDITAVEPSAAGCAILRDRCAAYPGVQAINQRFEEWPVERGAFDGVVAATSFHWLSPEVSYGKLSQALKPGGAVLLLWNVPPQPSEAIWRSLAPVYDAHAPALERFVDRTRQEQQLKGIGQRLIDFGGFARLEFERVDCQRSYTVEDYLALLRSLSPYILLEAEQREQLMRDLRVALQDRCGDRVETAYFSAFEAFRKLDSQRG